MGFWKPGKSNGKMHEYIGKNGLTLLLVPKAGMGVTTANITYHVGSRNEGLGLKGATHYLEHGMFKGSKHFHGKNGMWKLEEEGMYMNATTYTDRTNYFEVTETKHLNDAIVREADRMDAPLLTKELLDSEMSVVRNEMERGNNNDFEFAHKRLTATAFLAHPYHHSTIGWKSDVENVTAESLQQFHKTYYVPNNATYTFVGNFDPENVKNMVEDAFKNIPSGKDTPKMYTEEPQQMGQRRVVIEKPTETALLGIGFKSVNGMHRDAIVNQVLAMYISDGPTALVESLRTNNSSPIHDVMASFERMKDPYLFNFWVTTNYASYDKLVSAENDIMNLLTSIKAPSKKQLDTIKLKLKYAWQDQLETTRGMASEINESIARGDAFDVYEKFNVLDSITPDDIVRVSKQFDERQSTVVYVLPGEKAPEKKSIESYTMPCIGTSPNVLEKPTSDSINFQNASKLNQTQSFTSYNTNKNHLRLTLQTKSNFSPKEYASRLILAEMLSKGVYFNNGSYNASQVQEVYDKNGIKRDFSVSDYGIRVHFVLPNESNGVQLLKKELCSPLLNRSDFNYAKQRITSELRGAKNDVNSLAKTLLNQQLFNKGLHARHSTDDIINALNSLTHQNLIDEHNKLITGKSILTTFGKKDIGFDIASKGMINATPNRRYTSEVVKVNIPGKTSCSVLMGTHVNPSLATQIAVGCLGNGFSGRLMKHVRDDLGLTYGIEAFVVPKHGTMHITSTFNPTLVQKGIEETKKIIDEWKKGVTKEEIDIQKTIMKGIRKVRFDNPSNIINVIHMTKLNGENLEDIDNYDKKVDNVSFEDVQNAIKEINTNLNTVIVGTLQNR